MTCSIKQKARAKKKQSKNPPVAATKGLVRPSDVFPQWRVRIKEISIPKCNGAKVLRYWDDGEKRR